MKTSLLTIVAISLLACSAAVANEPPRGEDEVRVIVGEHPGDFESGSLPRMEPAPALTEAQREAIRKQIRSNIAALRAEGKLEDARADATVLFGRPLRLAPGLEDPGYHCIYNFVDHDPLYPDQLLDYECGGRSYDTSGGYNHKGTDFVPTPFFWRKMDYDEVEVIAAAPGTIVNQQDGNFDRSCSFNSNPWNAVYVRHEDGSIAWYGHMKNGSLTSKQVGDRVLQGEPLGIVGSSGNSTDPHLHLEVYDAADNLIDPYAGPCNSLNLDSWWESQGPYYDSAVTKITTGNGAPVFPACPNPEQPNAAVNFGMGPFTVYFTTYYRDQLSSQTSQYTIYRPDDSIFSQWTHNIGVPHYAWSYAWWSYNIPFSEQNGRWRFEVVFEGVTYGREFNKGPVAGSGRVPQYPVQGAVLEVAKAGGGDLRLDWGVSCVGADSDYAVYEGTIGGSFSSHQALQCSTGGMTQTILTPSAGDTYYLVGPRNALVEGSLGKLSDGSQRPVGLTACTAQRDFINCPL